MKGKYWLVLLSLLLLFAAGISLGRGSLLLDGAVLRGGDPSAHLDEISLSRPQSSGPATGRLNLNTATAEQLQELPGVGPTLAQSILTLRLELGGFTQVSQLLEAHGLGTGIYQKIKDLVYIGEN